MKTKTGNEEEATMDEPAAPDWAVRYTQVVSKRVRYYRGLRGLSAQQVSDRCGELGMPLARAVISHLENGRRESVSVGEVFCLARALEVAPIDLLTESEGATEIAPGLILNRTSAVGWVAGIPNAGALDDIAEGLADALEALERAQRAVAVVTEPLIQGSCAQCDNDPPAGYTCQLCGTPGRP